MTGELLICFLGELLVLNCEINTFAWKYFKNERNFLEKKLNSVVRFISAAMRELRGSVKNSAGRGKLVPTHSASIALLLGIYAVCVEK